jgi:hypothetical protein
MRAVGSGKLLCNRHVAQIKVAICKTKKRVDDAVLEYLYNDNMAWISYLTAYYQQPNLYGYGDNESPYCYNDGR